jgi:hypothetical protein
MRNILFVLLVFCLNSIFAEDKNHQLNLKIGYSGGSLLNSLDSYRADYNIKTDIIYSLLQQGQIARFEIENPGRKQVYPNQKNFQPSWNEFEYRYKNKFRFRMDYRGFETNPYDQNFLFLSNQGQNAGVRNTRIIDFSENRYRIGIGYIFHIVSFFNVGINLSNVSLQHTNLSRNFSLFSSSSTVTTTYSDERYYGLSPGIILEFTYFRNFILTYHFDYLNLPTSGESYRNSILSIRRGFDLTSSRFDSTLKGYNHRFEILYQINSFLGIQLGLGQDFYKKKYQNELYLSTYIPNLNTFIQNILIDEIVNSSIRSVHKLDFYSIQFVLKKEF